MSTTKTKTRPSFEDAQTEGPGEVTRRVAGEWRLSGVRAILFGEEYVGVFAHHAGQLVGSQPATMGIGPDRLPKYVQAECARMIEGMMLNG